MTVRTVDVQKARKDLRDLVALVVSGTEVVFTEGNTPIARLVATRTRVAGLHAGVAWTSPDFDAPLQDEFWTGEHATT
jgi:antitoxin (DNA-binding transcriptional repressor) of toxin-antitoxin stability system